MNLINPEIYIKDVSYFGYPSYMIYVPEVSIDNEFSKDNVGIFLNHFKILHLLNSDINQIELDDFIQFLLYITNWLNKNPENINLEEYLLLLCSILKNDKENIIAYSDFLIDRKEYDENITDRDVILYKIIKDYYTKENNQEYIEQKYTQEDVKKFYCLKNNLSLKSLLNFYATNSIKGRFVSDNERKAIKKMSDIILRAKNKYVPDYKKIRKLFK